MPNLVGIVKCMENHLNQSVNMHKGQIYKCNCKITNKIYIGITTKSIDIRIKEHNYSAFNKKGENYKIHFYNAIRKYGIDNFE